MVRDASYNQSDGPAFGQFPNQPGINSAHQQIAFSASSRAFSTLSNIHLAPLAEK